MLFGPWLIDCDLRCRASGLKSHSASTFGPWFCRTDGIHPPSVGGFHTSTYFHNQIYDPWAVTCGIALCVTTGTIRPYDGGQQTTLPNWACHATTTIAAEHVVVYRGSSAYPCAAPVLAIGDANDCGTRFIYMKRSLAPDRAKCALNVMFWVSFSTGSAKDPEHHR
jgi:hypothetical protein